MLIKRIQGCTRVLGVSQGFLGLPVRDEVEADYPFMVSAWEPTQEEIAALVAGGTIYLHVMGTTPPPMRMSVGPAAEEWG